MINFNFLIILMKKELGQIRRDKSVLVLAFLLPILLVIIYGFALRMDVKPVKIVIVSSEKSTIERDITSGFIGSKYFKVSITPDLEAAKTMFKRHEVISLLYFQDNFAIDFQRGKAQIMLIQNGSQAQLADISSRYSQAVVNEVLEKKYSNLISQNNSNLNYPKITINSRLWFNESGVSSWFLVSGQYVGIVTLVSIFIGCLVISREWDRGTMASLANTNASALEIVLAKVLTYYILSLCGVVVTLVFGELMLDIPIRGSVPMLLATLGIFVFEMTCLGALISAICKNQFLAQEYAIIVGFLPTVLLSGMIFDLHALPKVVELIGYSLPPTYAVKSLRICFLSGGGEAALWTNFFIQICWSVMFFGLAVWQVKKDSK